MSWPPEERGRRHFKGGEGKPPPQGKRREAATTQKAPIGETQAHNTNNNTQPHDTTNSTQQHDTNNNTTRPPHNHPPIITAARPSCLLILVCCLLPFVSVSVLSCVVSVLPRVCLCVVMFVCPGSSWFLPQFPSHQAVNLERVVLDLFEHVFQSVIFQNFSTLKKLNLLTHL